MVVILLGPPGVGKGTQAVRLADSQGWEHVSTGDLLRAARRDGAELGRTAQSYMDAGELVPDSLILNLVRDHLRGVAPEAGILFDGFPRTTAQAEGLEGVLEAVGRKVGRVVILQASDEELVKRLAGRRSCPQCGAVFNVHLTPPVVEGVCDRCGGKLMHRADDKPETVLHRLGVYRKQTEPLIAWYREAGVELAPVNAEAGVEEVQEGFRRAVGR